MFQWRAVSQSKAHGERLVLYYTILWISVVAVIVKLQLYESFTSNDFIKVGVALSVPCLLLSLLSPNDNLPFYKRYIFKANLFVLILSYLGNHFFTHYFYNVLGMRYIGPLAGGLRINDVPVSMYLMTQPYFLSYHVLVSPVLRTFINALKGHHWIVKYLIVGIFIYVISISTAFMETFTISSFPYYTYPDYYKMLTNGSLFYGVMFLVSFPLFFLIDEYRVWSLGEVSITAFGSMMMVMLLADVWRLYLGINKLPYS